MIQNTMDDFHVYVCFVHTEDGSTSYVMISVPHKPKGFLVCFSLPLFLVSPTYQFSVKMFSKGIFTWFWT